MANSLYENSQTTNTANVAQYQWPDGSMHSTPYVPPVSPTTQPTNTPVTTTTASNNTTTTAPTTTTTPTTSAANTDIDLQQVVPYKPQSTPLTKQEWLATNPHGGDVNLLNNTAWVNEQYNKYVSEFSPQTGLLNIADYTGQVVLDPNLALPADSQLSTQVPQFSQAETDAGSINQQAGMNNLQAPVAQTGSVAQANQVQAQAAQGYTAAQTQPDVSSDQMDAAQGTVSSQAQINPNDVLIDVEATALGQNAVGQALKDFAYLDPDDVDARATLVGQLDILQSQFFDVNGEPQIPSWASGIARNVSKIAAFKGITGTAATEAMSNALLEGTVQIAKQDAGFFATLTLQNLDNQQKSIIQRAATLANMDMANLDARTAIAVQNSKSFLEMDMANLNNEQQARMINEQNRIQSILEDAKSENASRLFLATSENEMAKFYDQLGAAIDQYNTSQVNGMSQFNVGQANSMAEFNAQLENNRDQFYRNLSYNIDVANAQWRQTIATTENQQKFEAAALDVKNKVAITQEGLNQLWDRADSLLDYLWKTGENELDRNAALVVAKIQAETTKSVASIQADVASSNQPGFLDVLGSVAGTLLGKFFGL